MQPRRTIHVRRSAAESAAAASPTYGGWSVGVSHYQGSDIDLHFAAKDADDFAAGFQIAAEPWFRAREGPYRQADLAAAR